MTVPSVIPTRAELIAAEVHTVNDLLGRHYTDDGLRAWWKTGNPRLNGRSPINLVLDGHGRTVIAMVRVRGSSVRPDTCADCGSPCVGRRCADCEAERRPRRRDARLH